MRSIPIGATIMQLENRYGKDYFSISDNGGLGIALVYGPKFK